MGGHGAIKVAKTVMEVADVAWTAMECSHHHLHRHQDHENPNFTSSEEELESLRSENQRLRKLLEKNLKLLENLSESPALLKDCPPDVRFFIFLKIYLELHSRCIYFNTLKLKSESPCSLGQSN